MSDGSSFSEKIIFGENIIPGQLSTSNLNFDTSITIIERNPSSFIEGEEDYLSFSFDWDDPVDFNCNAAVEPDCLGPALKKARNIFDDAWLLPGFFEDWTGESSSNPNTIPFLGAQIIDDDWSDEQIKHLNMLVNEHPDDWNQIASLLHRDRVDVIKKWESLRAGNMKRGQFNPDEDEHIVMRWLQWKIAGQQNGIWVALEKEMNRRDKRIAERWRSILMPRIEKQVFELQNQGLLPKAGKGHTGCSLEDKTILKALFAAYSSGTAAIPSGKGILFTRENIVGVQCIDAGIDTHVRKSKLTCVQYIKQDPLNDAVVQQIAEIPLSPQRAKPLFTIKWTNEMDQRLAEGIKLHSNDWTKISELVGMGTNNEKCRKRWYRLQRKTSIDED